MKAILETLLPAFLLSFVLTYISIPPIVRVSKAKHLFDEPNKRKLNKVVIPTLGGVGIFIGLTISFILFVGDDGNFHEIRYVFAAIVMLFFIGLKDDILVISAQKKLLVQIVVTSILVFLCGLRIESLNGVMGIDGLPVGVGQFLAFMIILFLTNAMNLIDGIDGLAAGIALFISVFLGTWFYNIGNLTYASFAFTLSGSLIAFLWFNVFGKENKIFMGDTGSLIIGVLLSVFAIKFNNLGYVASTIGGFSHISSLILALYIVPICDVLRVSFIRIKQKRSPFSPDMNHLHHSLIKLGLSHIQSSSILIGTTGLFVLFAIGMQGVVSATASFFSILTVGFILIGVLVRSKNIYLEHKKKHLELARKALTVGISKEEERTMEMMRKKRFILIWKRA